MTPAVVALRAAAAPAHRICKRPPRAGFQNQPQGSARELLAVLAGAGSSLSEGVLVAGLEDASATVVKDAVSPAARGTAKISLLGIATSGYTARKGVSGCTGGASGSGASLSLRLIPLTQRARVYFFPSLRIESDDAEEARHSASHAPPEPEKIFCLQARGLLPQRGPRVLLEAEARRVLGGTDTGDGLVLSLEPFERGLQRATGGGAYL